VVRKDKEGYRENGIKTRRKP